ncbi:anaphase-promoting complex subunit Hcn1 [Cichlidogyrus casuarinus]|uniref:Anaphase-promoting complex subunit Hcn1 n=1 Tax=Cichlidogyrus casuarinus TaxID=1844966 RepID=A0ABD2Q305_9PLAT
MDCSANQPTDPDDRTLRNQSSGEIDAEASSSLHACSRPGQLSAFDAAGSKHGHHYHKFRRHKLTLNDRTVSMMTEPTNNKICASLSDQNILPTRRRIETRTRQGLRSSLVRTNTDPFSEDSSQFLDPIHSSLSPVTEAAFKSSPLILNDLQVTKAVPAETRSSWPNMHDLLSSSPVEKTKRFFRKQPSISLAPGEKGLPDEGPSSTPGMESAKEEPDPNANLRLRNQFYAFFQPSDNKLAMKLFGNKRAVDREKRRQIEQGKWIIHPCSAFR